jgi:hypothetical protein
MGAARAAEVIKMTHMKSAEPGKPRSIARAFGKIFGFGIPATAVMTAALAVVFAVALDGCSSKSKKTSENQPSQNNLNQNSSPTVKASDGPGPVPTPVMPGVVAKKKTVKRPSTVTYTDNAYGVSFRYPRKYKLLTPDKGEQAKEELSKLPMNFFDAGGTSIAAIELNSGSATAFMNVSVLKGVNTEQCQQFAMVSPESSNDTPIEPNDESGVTKVSLKGVEFAKGDEVTEQLEARYYHHFEPGADKTSGSCYEFALGLSEPPEGTKPVDDVAIFEQLERIFGTVKIKPEPVTAVTASVPEQPASATNPQ